MRGLQGKVFAVTGGGGGIGSATVRRLIEEGARVAVIDVDAEAAAAVAGEFGDAAMAIGADVADEQSVIDYHRAILERFGDFHGEHLNAGIGGQWGVDMADSTMDDFDRVVAVDLRGVYLGMRESLRILGSSGHGGAIVTTASVGAFVSGRWVSAYTGAKAGVVGLTKAGAVNGGPIGVRVNCVAPGLVVTRMTDINESVAPDAAIARQAQIDTVPLGRAGSPDDVASTVAFLLSDDAGYVSGHTIPVDGGSLVDHPRARAMARLQAEAAAR